MDVDPMFRHSHFASTCVPSREARSRGRKCSVSVLYCFLIVSCFSLIAEARGRADDAVWKSYKATALEAESKEEYVLAERAWRAALAELDMVPPNDTRRFVSLAHLALAQVERELPDAESTLSRAEAFCREFFRKPGDATDSPTETSPSDLVPKPPAGVATVNVRIAFGLLTWARAKQDRTKRFSLARAGQFRQALNDLSVLDLTAVRLAQLAIESSYAHRDTGRPDIALRHAEQGIAAFRVAKVNDYRLADALALHALLMVELARTGETEPSLVEWLQIHERLKAERSMEVPREADYRFVLLRQSISQLDWPDAKRRLEYFEVGGPRENLPPSITIGNQLATAHSVLASVVEVYFAQGRTSEAANLVNRLKQDALNGTLECGQAIALDAAVQLSLGNLSASLSRLTDAQGQLTLVFGESHPQLIPIISLQAEILSETGDFDQAMKRAKEGLSLANVLPAGHPLGIEAVEMLARIELRRQHGAEARRFARQAWEMTGIPWPNGGAQTSRMLAVLTEAEAQSNSADARVHLEEVMKADVSVLPPLEQGFFHLHLARAAHLLDQTTIARSQYQDAMRSWSPIQSPSAPHPFAAPAQLGLALLEDLGKPSPGEATLLAMDAMRGLLGSDSQVAKELSGQGNSFYQAGRYREAIWLYDQAIEAYRRTEGDGSVNAQTVQEFRKRAQEAWDNKKE